MKKRLFSAVLVLLFSVACSVMAVAATSGGDEADEVVRAGGFLFHFNRDRTALSLWFCNRADRNMTLPDKVYYDGTTKEASLKPFGKAKAYTVEELEERTFRGNPDIQSVTIPASYRTVGGTAFMNCPNLKTFVGLGKDVMYGNDLFSGCTALENVTIDARAIGSHIFEGCERLIKPHITGTLDHIPDAAFQKSGIRSIDFIPQSVTAIWAGGRPCAAVAFRRHSQWGFLADEYPKRNRSGRLQRTARWGLRRVPFAQQSVAAEYAEIPWWHGILGYGNQADRYSELGYRPRSVSFLQLFTARFSPSFKSIGQVRTFYFPRYGIETHIPSGFHQEHRERLFHVL